MKDRRELLKGLAVSTAWATPVVTSVMLPAHARSSLQCLTNSDVTGSEGVRDCLCIQNNDESADCLASLGIKFTDDCPPVSVFPVCSGF